MTPSQNWSTAEDVVLFRAMATTILAARPNLYATPELAPWSKNGGSRINQKVQQLLKKFGTTIPGAASVVDEAVTSGMKAKKVKTPTTTPTKEENKGRTVTPKKRKRMVKEEDKSDVDDW